MTEEKNTPIGQMGAKLESSGGPFSVSHFSTDGSGDQLLSYLCRGGQVAHYWTNKGKESLWFPVDKIPAIPAKWARQNVYFSVHPCLEIPPTNSKGEATPARSVRVQNDYVAAVNCFYAEFDAKHWEGGKAAIFAHLDTLPLYPSVIIDSGGGYHCYWLLEHTVIVTDDNRDTLRAIQAAWVQLVGGDEGSKDFARILRVPGTLNVKPEYGPDFPTVTTIEANYRRLFMFVDFDDFTEHLRQTPQPEATATPAQPSQRTEGSKEGGVIQAYNERYKIVDVLTRYGYTGEGVRLSRPNKAESVGVVIHTADNVSFHWSSNDPLHRTNGNGNPLPVDPFEAYCQMEYNGNVKDAVKAAAALVGMEYKNGTGPIPDEAPDWLGADDWTPTESPHGLPDGQGAAAERGEAEKERFTDLGNARRFARLHGQDFRYTNQWGWLGWAGQRWERDATGEVHRAAKATATGYYSEAAAILDRAKAAAEAAGGDGLTDDKRSKLGEESNKLATLSASMTQWAKTCQARARLESIVKLAESELPIATKFEIFDLNPWLLNVENGTIDLRTGTLYPHRRTDLLTTLAPVRYDPDATCPRWLAFLDRIMDGNTEMVDFLRRAVGYGLTGDVSEQKLFFPHGGGANGKSTFMNTILSILGGDYAIQAAPELLVVGKDRHPTEVADLYGKRLVASIEVEDGRRLAEGLVKQLTGGDKIKARLMRQDFFQFDPTHKLWLVANHKPTVKGTDYAIWRRILLIPFDVTISDEEKDPYLPEKLKAESAGILAWAVRGCLEWQRQGLGIPESVKRATDAYRADSDTFSTFLAECTVNAKNAETKASVLYTAYETWCGENGERPQGGKQFGQKLTERGFDKVRTRLGIFYLGVGIVSQMAE